MLRLQGLAVHRVGEQHLVPSGVLDGQATLVVLDLVALYPPVQSRKQHLHSPLTNARFLQESLQGGAGPLGGADSFQLPWLADGARGQQGTTVPRALHGHSQGSGRAVHDLAEAQCGRPGNQSVYLEAPVLNIHFRDIEMYQQIVHAGGRQWVPQTFEGHATVARRQL